MIENVLERKHASLSVKIIAEVCGRAFFMLSVLALRNVTSLSAGMIWGQIKTGWIGLVLNAVIVPLSVVGLSRLLGKNDD